MITKWIRVLVALAGLVAGVAVARLPSQAASSCDALTGLTIPRVRISRAAEVPAGKFTPEGGQEPGGGQAIDVPAFCRVVAVATPTPDSTINFEVWLPPADVWNGKFQGVGNSGWSGAIPYGSMATALRRGYATAGTDTGHTGDDLSFAAGHPDKIVDWAYRGVHEMTVASKLVIRARQGKLPQHSYFTGCSTGGAQGLMSAQRYPNDYDGIVAGNPGGDRINRLASYIWAWNAAHQTPESRIPPEKLRKVNDAVLAACDSLDGIKDGVLDDPRRCTFDPGTLLCRGEANSDCLTSRQLEALRKIYNGPHHPREVRQIYPGVPKGSEAGSGDWWERYIMDPPEPPRVDFWKHFVFGDPAWDHQTFDWDRDLDYARERWGAIVDATNPDLRPFKAQGGRIIMTAGWNDAVHLAEQAIVYYEYVQRALGGDDKTKDFFRLFLVPGMGHCAPGPGPSTFDALTALEMWVENQVVPERIIASRTATNEAPARTRPLCAYPLVARWKGSGSTDDAANFNCGSPPRGR